MNYLSTVHISRLSVSARIWLVLGLTLLIYPLVWGYNPVLNYLWIATLGVGVYFLWPSARMNRFHPSGLHKDLVILLALMAGFLPIYCGFNYDFPQLICSDEVHIMLAERNFLADPQLSLLQASPYFGFPAFIFILYGRIGTWMGGITLLHMRLVSGVVGLLIIGVVYSFYRIFWPRFYAAAGAVLLGSSHVLITLGRMALRDNTALLTELAALSCLCRGWVWGSPWWSYVGGIFMGLGYYVYFPGRITLVLWALFLGWLYWQRPKAADRRRLRAAAGWSLGGFVLTVAPLMIDTWRKAGPSTGYMKEQCLLFQAGRELQQRWCGASSIAQGIGHNILNAFTFMNRPLPDNGWGIVDPTWQHGFSDPLSGIFVWVGLAYLVYRDWRGKKTSEFEMLIAGGFVFLMTFFAFIVGKAPDYTRLTVMTPMIAALVLSGIHLGSRGVEWILRSKVRPWGSLDFSSLKPLCIWLAVVSVAGVNLSITSDILMAGFEQGSPLGSAARYLERYAGPSYGAVYIVGDTQQYAFSPGYGPEAWISWLRFFARPGVVVEHLSPDQSIQASKQQPCIVILKGSLWQETQSGWRSAYPALLARPLDAHNTWMALEL